METFVLYLLKSSLLLSAVGLLYLLLRSDHHFRRNRWFLLAGLLISQVVPFIPSGAGSVSGSLATVHLAPVLAGSGAGENQQPELLPLILLVYTAGVLLLLIRLLMQAVRIFWLARHAAVSQHNGCTLYRNSAIRAPFSFFKALFLGTPAKGADEKAILTHELAHARQYHSIDILLAESVILLQWFNPLAWYYKKLLAEVHEYLADRQTLRHGIPTTQYFQLLLATACNIHPAVITNNFYQIKLKRRITMMTTSKTSRYTGVKFAGIALMVAMISLMVACTNADLNNGSTNGNDSLDSQKAVGTEEVFTEVEQMPEYPGGQEAMAGFLSGNIKYPAEAKDKGIQGTVYVAFVVAADGNVTDIKIEKGVGYGCDEEALRVVKQMPKWKPGVQKGQPVAVSFVLPIKFALQ